MVDFFFLLSLSIPIASMLIIYLEIKLNKGTNTNNTILAISIIIAISSVLVAYNDYIDNENLHSATKNIQDLSEENKVLNKKNLELTTINTKLTNDVLNWFTGGNSFPYIILMNNGEMSIGSKGTYPVRDVEVWITDYYFGTTKKMPKAIKKEYSKSIGNIKPNSSIKLNDIHLSDFVHDNLYSLVISLRTRNKWFSHTVSGVFKNGKIIKEQTNNICEGNKILPNVPKELDKICKKANFIWAQ